MTPEIIQETERTWQAQPEKAKGNPIVTRTGETGVELESGPFKWQTDLPPPLGGKNQASTPTLALLGALAGCAAAFIQDTLAPQLGIKVDSVEATARCRTDARGLLALGGAMPDLTDLELQISIQSSESQDKLNVLYETWLARCPVYLALTKPTPVNAALQIQRGQATA
jgi:uncharacterized OsmC-like protein